MLFIVPLPLYCLFPPLFPNRTLLLRIALIPFGHFSRAKIKKQWKKFTSLSSQSVNFLNFLSEYQYPFSSMSKGSRFHVWRMIFVDIYTFWSHWDWKLSHLAFWNVSHFEWNPKQLFTCSSRRKYSAFSQGGILSETLTICKFKI